ncbi:putative protein kinase [Trypanosoma grayi]|uniref:putative protein kinase n=1 Tax=Trypanosoma grayi TaxID=71804 RepID=UPI0004F49883|nr:putative protein kinase [Trypanosoma grayi]KEG12297.1 putative protein kinase [Trypanosoma grayi]
MLVDNATGRIVVGKLADLTHMSGQSRNFARTEAVNIANCEHPNIIQLLDTYEANESLLHILEYADAGDLMTQVECRAKHVDQRNSDNVSNMSKGLNRPVPFYYMENEILVILAQLCLAIKYIHDKKIMHRDLKTPNVLLTKSGLIKLGDFGFSRQYDKSLSDDVGRTFCGTPCYLSPELWRRESYSYKADIWSLGVLLYELMTLRKPFPSTNMRDLMQRVLKEGSYDPLPTDRYSQGLCDLCRSMLRVNPQERPSIIEVLATPILLKEGLQYLKTNVPRLRDVDQAVRDRLVREVDAVQRMCSVPTLSVVPSSVSMTTEESREMSGAVDELRRA